MYKAKYVVYYCNILLGTTPPQLRHLYEKITPLYAPQWKVLGELLHVPNGELRIIEADHPNNVKGSCNKMLDIWLNTDPNASWEAILTAIKSPAIMYSDSASASKCEE